MIPVRAKSLSLFQRNTEDVKFDSDETSTGNDERMYSQLLEEKLLNIQLKEDTSQLWLLVNIELQVCEEGQFTVLITIYVVCICEILPLPLTRETMSIFGVSILF